MSSVCFFNAMILDSTEKLFFCGSVLCENGVISEIYREAVPTVNADKTVDLGGAYLIPGFTDAHTHGRDGFDFASADEQGMKTMLMGYLSRGVTSVFPTLASAPFDTLLEKGAMIRDLKEYGEGAHVLGVHLEGRYLNPKKGGAHAPELLALPCANEVDAIVDNLGLPLHVSAAYELDTDETFIRKLTSLGASVGLAHTEADFDTAHRLYEKYGISLTHTFNAMPPLHHRAGGAVCAGLCDDMYTELICDGIHVAPEMVRLLYKAKGADRLVLVTDSMEATDSPDGEYSIAGNPVIVKDSIARTPAGNLAGSTLNLLDAVNNLVRFTDATPAQAICCATLNPCRMLGLGAEYGSIEKGKRADLLSVSISDNNEISLLGVYRSAK